MSTACKQPGEPGGDDGRAGRGLGLHRQAREMRRDHCSQQERGAQNIGRHQSHPHPGEALADAVLHAGQRIERQAEQNDEGRLHEMAAEGLKQPQSCHCRGGDERAYAESDGARSANEAAQQWEIAGLPVMRDETDAGDAETEVRQAAEHEHPSPDEDVDAVFVAAHPTGQHDLRQIKESRADAAHAERRHGVALGALALAAASEDGGRLRDDASERRQQRWGGRRADGGIVRHWDVRPPGVTTCTIMRLKRSLGAASRPGSFAVQALALALAHTFCDIGPGDRSIFVALLDVKACEKFRHLGRMESVPRLEDGCQGLELSLVHARIWLPDACHDLHPTLREQSLIEAKSTPANSPQNGTRQCALGVSGRRIVLC